MSAFRYYLCSLWQKERQRNSKCEEYFAAMLWHVGFYWSLWDCLDHSFSVHTSHLAFKSRSWKMLFEMKGMDTVCIRRLGLSSVYIRIFLLFPMLVMPAGVPRAHVRDPWPRLRGKRWEKCRKILHGESLGNKPGAGSMFHISTLVQSSPCWVHPKPFSSWVGNKGTVQPHPLCHSRF